MRNERIASLVKTCAHGTLGAMAALALLGGTPRAFADPPVSLAPPSVSTDADGAPVDASADTVFQWTEIPQNQKVPLTRAVFDQNGYQLYDTAGETVIVPFTNNNLYVMKFAPSDDDTMYLINQGDAPVLYVPDGGYLDNATVSGARWYPFSTDFHPAQPVFLGVAPSWSAFVSIGWAPDVIIRGGYWGHRSFIRGGIFLPSAGIVFEVGGNHYDGWDGYHDYYVGHPDHFRSGYGGGGRYHGRVFRGAGPGYGHDGDHGGYHTDNSPGRGDDHGYSRGNYGSGHDGDHGPGPGHDSDHSSGGRHVFRGARGGGDSHRDHH